MNLTRRERRERRRTEREQHNDEQQTAAARRARSKRAINCVIISMIVMAAGYGVYAALKPGTTPGRHDELAQCLTSNGATMYGTDWCPHCKAQKELFGSSFRYVTYLNCDTAKAACDAAGVQGYPTWTFPKGEPLAGEQPLALLAERAGCAVNATS